MEVSCSGLPRCAARQCGDCPDARLCRECAQPPDASGLTSYGAPTSVVDDPKVPGGKALRIQASKGANPWDAAVVSPLHQPVHVGDALVLAFWARLVSGENGVTGVTLPSASVSLGTAPWTQLFGGPVTVGQEWKLIELRGTADKEYAAGALNAGIEVATGNQTIDFGPLYVAKVSGGAVIRQAATPAAPQPRSLLATLDPATIASKIVNDPSAPEVRGVKGKLIDDPQVTGGKALRVEVPRKGQNAWDISVNSALKKPVKAGDTLLLVFPARLVEGENGANSTTLPWNSVRPDVATVVGGDWRASRHRPGMENDRNHGEGGQILCSGMLAAGVRVATARQTISTFGPSSFSISDKGNSGSQLAADRSSTTARSFPAEPGKASQPRMKHYLLFYEAGPDYLERRPQFRGKHLRRAWEAAEHGELSLPARSPIPSTARC